MMDKALRTWWIKEERLPNADCVFFLLWVAIFDQIIAVPIQLVGATFGDKIAGIHIVSI